jgi:hypothetical protein
LGVNGRQPGRRLAIVTAGLDRRVTRLAAYYPALSDVTGYLHARAGGWPHMFRATEGAGPPSRRGQVHHDALLRRRELRPPRDRAGTVFVGLQRRDVSADVDVCGLQRHHRAQTLMLAYDKGHQSTQEQVDDVNGWLGDELTGGNPPPAGR